MSSWEAAPCSNVSVITNSRMERKTTVVKKVESNIRSEH